jgi:hypothetical protein
MFSVVPTSETSKKDRSYCGNKENSKHYDCGPADVPRHSLNLGVTKERHDRFLLDDLISVLFHNFARRLTLGRSSPAPPFFIQGPDLTV